MDTLCCEGMIPFDLSRSVELQCVISVLINCINSWWFCASAVAMATLQEVALSSAARLSSTDADPSEVQGGQGVVLLASEISMGMHGVRVGVICWIA
jgi:hypothetical protein